MGGPAVPRVRAFTPPVFRPFARLAAGMLLLFCVASPARAAEGCAQPGYNVAPSIATGISPVSVAVGDFNRDGLSDLAVANNASGTASILLGVGDGTFSAPRHVPVGIGPESLVVADFNGDGASDLAASRNNDKLSILLGNGDGTFGAPSELDGGGIGPTTLSVGDFNGDARSDLAMTNANTDDVSIFLGTGAGTFNGPARFDAGDQPTYSAVGDFNNDGKSDLAIAGGSIRILLGNGDGAFGAPSRFNSEWPAHSVAVADFNGDGKGDLVVGNVFFGNRVTVWLGTGTGTFNGPTHFVTGKDPRFVTAGDFNGDGKADIVAANREADNVSVLLGDGAGNFAKPANYGTGGGPVSVATGDFNGDGKRDLATANVFSGDGSILLGVGGGAFAAPASLSFLNPSSSPQQDDRSGPSSVVSGDFNGDGKRDVAISNFFSRNISVLLGTGSGTFGERTNFSAGNRLRDLAAGDFNGDGRGDLAVVTGDPDGVSVLPGTAAGGFGTPIASNAGPSPASIATGDFNRDGRIDLAITNSNSATVSVLLGTGDGGFNGPNSFAVGAGPQSLAVGDFNGDGKSDLAVGNIFSESVSILLGDGAGGFASAGNVRVGDSPASIAVGEFNGDGKSDLAVVNQSLAGALYVFTGAGDGTFTLHARITTGLAPGFVAARDFNNDGATDLGVVLNRHNRVTILLGDGRGVFAGPYDFYAGASPTRMVDGDFNADGMGDLVVTNAESDTVNILLGRQARQSPTTQFCAAGYSLNEGVRSVRLTVSRGGDVSGPAQVGYLTTDATASDRTDYTAALGTLRFAPGEASKTITVLITDDAFAEGAETFTVRLVDASGTTLGTRPTATVTLNDNDNASRPSPVGDAAFDTQFFVRQHYLDFFSREPDAPGLAHWMNVIDSCGANAQCREVNRINVSGAFFLSIEFKETGYLVERIYKAAYGDAVGTSTLGGTPHQLPVPVVRLEEFLPDTQRIGQGVVVLRPGWEDQLEANKTAFTQEFVRRQRFLEAFPAAMTPAQFVDQLNTRAGNPLDAAERQALVNELTADNTTAGRASVLRKVAEDKTLEEAEKNRAFVLMQYFGYLRRDPNEGPDADYTGYDFWLGNLEKFNGNFVQAELVKAFISSTEYRQRFGQ